jgi:protein-S-isoprenylcysteine O-methyltransferase Ste14
MPPPATFPELDTFEAVLRERGVHEALRFLNRRTPHRYTGVYRYDGDTLRSVWLFDRYAPDVGRGDDLPLANAYCAHIVEQGGHLAFTDARTDSPVPYKSASSVISYCGVLISDREGNPFGALCHFDTKPCLGTARTSDAARPAVTWPTSGLRSPADGGGVLARGPPALDAMAAPPDLPGIRFPPPFLFVLGFVGGLLLDAAVPLGLVPGDPSPLWAFVGWTLVALGLVLAGWAMFAFHGARTPIIPVRPTTALVEVGPYRFTRNPMYVGLGLVYLGLALWLDALWPVLLLPGVYVLLWRLVVRREERYLEGAFGEPYAAYRRRVRRWL